MPQILALCTGESRRIIQEQLGATRAGVRYVATLAELENSAKQERIDAIVADLFDAKGEPVVPALREMRQAFPEVQLVLSYEPSPAALDDVLGAAMSGAPFGFVARPSHDVGLLLRPLLAGRSARAPNDAGALVEHLLSRTRTTIARRCVTFGAVSPCHQLSLAVVARCCGTNANALYRDFRPLMPPRTLLNALAWVQASYLLAALHWRARHVAWFFGFGRPAMLIELLVDYVESGLWRLGLDPGIDDVAARQAAWLNGAQAPWPHHRRFRACRKRALTSVLDSTAYFDGPGDFWLSTCRRRQIAAPILSMIAAGMAPVAIVRRLLTRHDVTVAYLYRSVMGLVHAARIRGLIEEEA